MTIEKRIILLKKTFDSMNYSYSRFSEDVVLLRMRIDEDLDAMSEAKHVEKEENISKGIINLTKDDSLNALVFLLRDKKYSKKAFEFLRKINIKSISIVQELWKVYEERHLFIDPCDLLLVLAKIEGKESRALKLLHEEKKYNRLWGEQLANFEKLCLDFQIEEKFLNLIEDAEIKGQEETIVGLSELREFVDERIGKTIGLFDKAIEEQDLLITKERKEGLQKQIEQIDKRIEESYTNTRLFLIFISIIFILIAGAYLALSGWLISLLVKLMELMSS